MRILLVAAYRNDKQESMQRFADVMARGLSEAGHTVRTIRAPAVFGRLMPSPTGLGKWLGYIDKFLVFPPLLKAAARKADVVHFCDHSNPFYSRYAGRVPNVVTCHDIIPIANALGELRDHRMPWTGKLLQRMLLRGLARAQYVACVSAHTEKELLRLTGRDPATTARVYNGLNYPYTRMDESKAAQRLRALGVSGRFLLHVGGNQWYKNRLGVLKIFAEVIRHDAAAELKLVLAGKTWTEAMREFVQANGLADRVVELMEVKNEDLRALYSSAVALVFPSLQEGFGWPILEAQACGCPVFTSNRPPMTEVGGNAAVYFDPTDTKVAAEAIILNLPRLRDIGRAGVGNAEQSSTKAMIADYVALYQMLGRSPAGAGGGWAEAMATNTQKETL